MALSIKTEEADRLARELAALTGRSMTAVVTEALQEKLAIEVAARNRAGMADRLQQIAAVFREGLEDRSLVTKAEYDALTEDGFHWPEADAAAQVAAA